MASQAAAEAASDPVDEGGLRRCDECGVLSADGLLGEEGSPHEYDWYCSACWASWLEESPGPPVDPSFKLDDPPGPTVERRTVEDIGALGELFDGSAPLIVSGAVAGLLHSDARPAGAGRLLELAAHLDETLPAHNAAHLFPRDEHLLLRYTVQDPPVIIQMAVYASAAAGGRNTYWALTEDTATAFGISTALEERLGLRRCSELCGLPLELLPRWPWSMSLAGVGAGGPLRRDPVGWCQCSAALAGKQYWRFLPPNVSALALEALSGDLGCAVSTVDLYANYGSTGVVEVWSGTQHEGDLVLIPPGWWHQSLACLGGTIAVVTPWLGPAVLHRSMGCLGEWLSDAPIIIEPLLSKESSEKDNGDDESENRPPMLVATPMWGRLLPAASRRGNPGCGGWPFPLDRPLAVAGGSSSASSSAHGALSMPSLDSDGFGFEARLHRLLDEFPHFLLRGVALPVDAPDWEPEDLGRFIASGGFLAPLPRGGQPDRQLCWWSAAPGPYLADWLDIPIHIGVEPDWCPTGEAPRVVWMFWQQGLDSLSGFRRLCIHSWRVRNPSWTQVVLDVDSALGFVDASDLPEQWLQLPPRMQSDSLRLALLARYGGVWADINTLCLRPLDDWAWARVTSESPPTGMCAFFVPRTDAKGLDSREFVENWFIAARRAHPFVVAWWKLHKAGWRDATSRMDYVDGPLFSDIDLSHFVAKPLGPTAREDPAQIARRRKGGCHRNYLLMHVAFKKLIDEDTELRRIWAEEMFLLPAAGPSGPMSWAAGLKDGPEDCVRHMVFKRGDVRAASAISSAPMLKFTGGKAQALEWQPSVHLTQRGSAISHLLAAALPLAPPLSTA